MVAKKPRRIEIRPSENHSMKKKFPEFGFHKNYIHPWSAFQKSCAVQYSFLTKMDKKQQKQKNMTNHFQRLNKFTDNKTQTPLKFNTTGKNNRLNRTSSTTAILNNNRSGTNSIPSTTAILNNNRSGTNSIPSTTAILNNTITRPSTNTNTNNRMNTSKKPVKKISKPPSESATKFKLGTIKNNYVVKYAKNKKKKKLFLRKIKKQK